MNAVDRDALFLSHRHIAKRAAYDAGKGVKRQEWADLIAAAELGLLRAASRYDPATGVKFSTYGYQRAYGEAKDWIRLAQWTPRKHMEATGARIEMEGLGSSPPALYAPDPYAAVDAADEVEAALSRIPKRYHGVLRERAGEGLAPREYAARHGITRAAASQRYLYAQSIARKRVSAA